MITPDTLPQSSDLDDLLALRTESQIVGKYCIRPIEAMIQVLAIIPTTSTPTQLDCKTVANRVLLLGTKDHTNN